MPDNEPKHRHPPASETIPSGQKEADDTVRTQAEPRRCRRRRMRTLWRIMGGLIATYLLLAYVAMPAYWTWRTRRVHPALEQAPRLTSTHNGLPGDALNIAIIGAREDLTRAMLAARWHPADAITLESSLRIAADVVFDRPYVDAPVSNLYVWGRKEDLAFEQPVGHDPRHRHHVRFWQSQLVDSVGQPVWIGAGTYDVRVELSRETGQITHRISPDIDAERDNVVATLRGTRYFAGLHWVDDFQPKADGYNGGGDPWHTDQRLAVVTLGESPALQAIPQTAPSQEQRR